MSVADLPLPPVPADLDLRDFRWMKLDLIALFNSDFNATPDDTAWRAGVTLWGKAWHQVPAGSLPDDDATLCNLAGLGRDLKTWRRIREVALRGFAKCADGRLYHVDLCRMALAASEASRRRWHRLARRLEIFSDEWAALRSAVFARDDFTCRYCGARGVSLECDHVVPVVRGGATEPDNLVTACKPCNRSKGAKSLLEWRMN